MLAVLDPGGRWDRKVGLARGQHHLRHGETKEGERHPLEPFRDKKDRGSRHGIPNLAFTLC
jgi:hypothetical protein